jgi:hypothetical protein
VGQKLLCETPKASLLGLLALEIKWAEGGFGIELFGAVQILNLSHNCVIYIVKLHELLGSRIHNLLA